MKQQWVEACVGWAEAHVVGMPAGWSEDAAWENGGRGGREGRILGRGKLVVARLYDVQTHRHALQLFVW